MMVSFNHFISAIITPLNIGLIIFLLGVLVACKSKYSRTGKVLYILGVVWLWLWMTPFMFGLLGRNLELSYPIKCVENIPNATAIAILGGGMGVNTNACPYAECWGSVDRVVHGARLYRAKKAKIITITGKDTDLSTIPLLLDLGVPHQAIHYVEGAGNTEEEGRMIGAFINGISPSSDKKVILVTSAWHMRRAEMMFKKAGVDVIAAPCDYETIVRAGREWHFSFTDFLPAADMLASNTVLFKEYFAYWAYKLIRGF